MRTSDTNEAVAIASALRPTVDEWERESSRSCVRAKKMTVASAYDGDTMTIGVREAFTPDIMSIPCMPDLSTVSVGDTIWVLWLYGDKSTMVAMWRGDIVTPADLPDPRYYYAGDAISGSFMVYGFVTNSRKDLYLYVPTTKSTENVSLDASDITVLTISLRYQSGIMKGENYDILTDSTVTDITATMQQGGICLLMTSTADWYSANNTPVIGTISLTGTFS